MTSSKLRVLVCCVLVTLPVFPMHSQDLPEGAPGSEPAPLADEAAGREAAAGDTRDDPFTLFPFITDSRDPGSGSEYYQAFGLYHRWRDPLPGGGTDEFTLAFPTFFNDVEDDKFLTTWFPFYWSWGTEDAFTSVGFPLYWRGHTQEGEKDLGTGFKAFVPFYFHIYSPTDTDRFIVPFYSYRSFPGEEEHALFGPLYVYQRFENLRGEKNGSAHSFAWPLTTFENREDDYTYRVLPFFSVSEKSDSSSLLLTPLYYESAGTGGQFRYVFPFIASSSRPGETTDRYGMGLYTRERAHDSEGTLLRSRDDALWGAVSFQRDIPAGRTHERVLPLAYWNTEAPDSSSSLHGPFYYTHRSTDESDNRWSLDMVLGNLYVSSRVEGPPEYSVTPASVPKTAPEESTTARGVAETVAGPPQDPGGDRSLYPMRVERSVEKGILWPLIRWHRDELGHSGHWFVPFYFDDETDTSSTLAVFPLAYTQDDEGPYELSFFRYFFLWNSERWSTGERLTVGQVLFDWTREDTREQNQISVLYPFFEVYEASTGYGFQLMQVLAGDDYVDGGDRETGFRLFPFFWYGFNDRQNADGDWVRQSGHFYLLPFYGFESTTTRVDYYALYPLLHIAETADSFDAEFWPLVFWRDQPTLQALRIWPLHSSEAGESAGDVWWADWLYLSKYSFKPGKFSYRLDPFLYSYESNENESTSSLDVLFGLYQKDTAGQEARHTLFWFLTF